MLITIVNEAPQLVCNGAVLTTIRAIARQIFHDFTPYWHLSAQLRLATVRSTPRELLDLNRDAALQQLDPVSGGGVIRLRLFADEMISLRSLKAAHGKNHDGAQGFLVSPSDWGIGTFSRGYHLRLRRHHFPVGHVIVNDAEDATKPREDWTVSLSHEVLEMIANPHVNLRVEAPHPDPAQSRYKRVYVHREVCDPVQDEYTVDGIRVANFVLPLYFVEGGHRTERIDFLGSDGFKSFGVKPGGYIPYFDPETGKEEKYWGPPRREVGSSPCPRRSRKSLGQS
jgi:hypothetical protein